MNELSGYVAEQAKNNDMAKHVKDNDVYCNGTGNGHAESKMILANYYKKCKKFIAISPDYIHKRGTGKSDMISPRDGEEELPAVEYYFVKCGEGCCVTSDFFCVDANGDVVNSYHDTEVIGDCTPVNVSNGPCVPLDWNVTTCYTRCQ